MIIGVGADKSGFGLKEEIKNYLLEKQDVEIHDLGMTSPDEFKAYYQVAPVVAKKIQNGEIDKGILICGTGAGMAVAANKFKGVYAVSCESVYSAGMAKVVNNSNILTMGAWIIAPQIAIEMVETWLTKKFTEGFAEDRQKFLYNAFKEVEKIEEKEGH